MATLAANGHNTQPWKFKPVERSVRILPDTTRRTEVVDPDDHYLYVSLGCAAENFGVAAAAHGRRPHMMVAGDDEVHIDISLEPGPRETADL